MAKKRGRKKKAQEIQRRELPGGFWRQIGAVLMIETPLPVTVFP